MVDLYGTCNSNEQNNQFWFDRLKTDQVSTPVHVVDQMPINHEWFNRSVTVTTTASKATATTPRYYFIVIITI